VTCHEIDEFLASHSRESELPPAAAAHIAACERCRQLVRILDKSMEAPAPSESQLKQIQSALLRDLKPVRPLMRSRVFLFAFGLLFLGAVAIGSLLLGVSGWRALSTGQKIVVFTASAIGGISLALSLVRQMVPGSKHAIPPIQLPIAVSALLILVMAAVFQPRYESAFVSSGLTCLRIGMTYSIPTAFLLWLMLRRGAWLSPKLTGATAGVFAGLIGVTVLEVFCPNLNLYHILIWHLGVIALSALGGLLLGTAAQHIAASSGRRTFQPVSKSR
jgi:hypothetical protein